LTKEFKGVGKWANHWNDKLKKNTKSDEKKKSKMIRNLLSQLNHMEKWALKNEKEMLALKNSI
tara:strand:+ start:319 stop:507 length:189 start_codon:yes stop_codon:yes gene_type:complete